MEFIMGAWGADGTIFFYAILNLIGFIFNLAALKETKGLSDADKKLIYSPLTSVGEAKINVNDNTDKLTFNTKLGEQKFGGQNMVRERGLERKVTTT